MKSAWLFRLLVPCLSATLLFALACGGSDSNGDENESGDPTATTQSEEGSNADTDLAPDTAVVVLDGQRYEFDMTSDFGDTCLTLFGVVGGAGESADGRDISVSVEIPPEDWETSVDGWDPPSLRVSIDDLDDPNQGDWRAGGDIVANDTRISAEDSGITSFSNEDGVAKGEATFINYGGFNLAIAMGEEPPAPKTGTFEVYCG